MITIRIGNDERSNEDVSEQWITQQINRRRDDNAPACVTVVIHQPPLNMTLRTPGCTSTAPSGGAGRAPNDQERKIFDLWDRLGLNGINFSGGNVVAFIKQLRM